MLYWMRAPSTASGSTVSLSNIYTIEYDRRVCAKVVLGLFKLLQRDSALVERLLTSGAFPSPL